MENGEENRRHEEGKNMNPEVSSGDQEGVGHLAENQNDFRVDVGKEGEGSSVVMNEEKDAGLKEHIRKTVTIRTKALGNIQVAQALQKIQYDEKHSQDKAMYKVGSLVFVKNSRKLSWKGSNMALNWLGSFHIHEVLNKGTFRLSQVEGDKNILAQVHNITRF